MEEDERRETERESRVSILKSFIVLQKSNYYLTRKKDKWQIIYITNARPAHTDPPNPPHLSPFLPTTLALHPLSPKPYLNLQMAPPVAQVALGLLAEHKETKQKHPPQKK